MIQFISRPTLVNNAIVIPTYHNIQIYEGSKKFKPSSKTDINEKIRHIDYKRRISETIAMMTIQNTDLLHVAQWNSGAIFCPKFLATKIKIGRSISVPNIQ